jgi:hypothetical protein
MVRSRIFNECVYLETKQIKTRDEETELQLFSIKLLNCENVYITVGTPTKKSRIACLTKNQRDKLDIEIETNPQSITSDDTLLYYLIYLMDADDNETAICRIGIYEIPENKKDAYIDDDGDLIIDDLEPLLFKFVNSAFLEKNKYYCSPKELMVKHIEEELVKQAKEKLEKPKEQDPILILDSDNDNNDGVSEYIKDTNVVVSSTYEPDNLLSIYPKQTAEQYNEEHTKKYLSRPLEGDRESIQWIKAYLMNSYYKILDKGGAGDCLFYSLSSAINDYSINNNNIGIPVYSRQDVTSLREVISNGVTEADYDNYVTIYKDLNNQKIATTREIKILIKQHEQLSQQFKMATNDSRRKELMLQSSDVKKRVKELEEQLMTTKEILTEFEYMKYLKTLKDFKAYILTSNYWGDEMALSILQKHFNFKAVIMSQEEFVKGVKDVSLPLSEGFVKNMKNIIQCGSTSLGGVDNPYFYIILNFTGNHYQIVSYRDKEAFTFDDIPFSLKLAITRGCMKTDLASGYGKIDNFVKFRDDNIELMF